MNPLIITTSDINGGAARAAYRLHQGLKNLDVPSQMLVHTKMSGDRTVMTQTSLLSKMAPMMNRLPLIFYPHRQGGIFSPQWFPDKIQQGVAQLNPNIISLHWVSNGYLQIETLARLKKPLVWTLHDFWVFTGGCHYPQQCDRYTKSCGNCPHLSSQTQWDLSHWIWRRKAKIYPDLNLTLVAPSYWLAQAIRQSSLGQNLPLEVIPHGLNTDVYQPIPQEIARKILNLPQDKHLILFGADSGSFFDRRKGLHLLYGALQKFPQTQPEKPVELVFFGVADSQSTTRHHGWTAHYLGRFYDDVSLALIYAAADVTVVPSMEEAFGQTASESLACGTPVVAFADTGIADIVEHQINGYLASPFDVQDLAAGISWVLDDTLRRQKLGYLARASALKKFTLQLQAERYLSLFSKILGK
ncbi:glycosyl transferase [Merismopedia glauca CCAP 1448/3]|uniref:Glycosyl transferase n=1 Tax=Merismopedia glauca CCAP 1448/3 TaxID=1296344 RepID=A0A2T1C5M8_9CYAN|nr:glycosyl transferase [Merismopedia glauca CCAP 1448/3]